MDLEIATVLNKIILNYKKYIPDICDGLSAEIEIGENYFISSDLYHDTDILKSRLEHYKHEQLEEEKIRKESIEKQNQLIINNSNINQSHSNSSAIAITTVTISQTIDHIDDLPESTLSNEESEELKELILSIEKMIAAKDNNGAKSKISKVLSTIGNKGFDLFVAVAPYLLQAAGVIQII